MSLFYLTAIGAVPLTVVIANLVSFLLKVKHINNPLHVWNNLHSYSWVPLKLRLWFYYFLFRFNTPFASVVDFRVTEMAKGNAVVVMKNTRKTSNLYGATHAGTMVSFTETTSALAVFSLFGPKDRALCTNLNIDYLKKGTGILTATSAVPKVKDRSVKNIYTEVIVTNEKIETVAKMTLTFRTDFRSEKTD